MCPGMSRCLTYPSVPALIWAWFQSHSQRWAVLTMTTSLIQPRYNPLLTKIRRSASIQVFQEAVTLLASVQYVNYLPQMLHSFHVLQRWNVALLHHVPDSPGGFHCGWERHCGAGGRTADRLIKSINWAIVC